MYEWYVRDQFEHKEFMLEEKNAQEGGTGVSYIEDVFIVALVTYDIPFLDWWFMSLYYTRSLTCIRIYTNNLLLTCQLIIR